LNERIDRDRLSVVTGALLMALALARLLDVPPRPFQVTVFGSPLGFNLSETTILLLIIGGMAATGVESLARAHPLLRQEPQQRTIVYWVVPALLAVALASWLSRIADVGFWLLGMLAAALLIPLALVAEYAAVSPQRRRDTWLQWAYSVLIHLVGLILFSALYDARLRGLLAAPLLFVSVTLLAARLFWAQTSHTRQSILHGAVAGLILGQLILMLNYWPLSSLQGGLVLLLAFYLVVALLERILKLGRLERRFVFEYLGVALLALLAILIAVP
jgi:hypothetical protein